MARRTKLKVYRTAIGFHDAYVAAPSQKAALAAWGSDHNLFARGVAEIVTDPALAKEPLAQPGKVVKRLRGTAAEQIAALPKDGPVPASRAHAEAEETKPSPRAARLRGETRPQPKPSRAAVDAAEGALASSEARYGKALAALREREAELARDREALDEAHAREIGKLEKKRRSALQDYEEKIRNWRG